MHVRSEIFKQGLKEIRMKYLNDDTRPVGIVNPANIAPKEVFCIETNKAYPSIWIAIFDFERKGIKLSFIQVKMSCVKKGKYHSKGYHFRYKGDEE